MPHRHTAKCRRRLVAQTCRCEPLEPRRMLAVIVATSGNDTITISASGGNTHININGNVSTTGDSSIFVNCGEGHDVIHVNSTRSGTTIEVRGENGFDSLSNTPANLDAVYLGSVLFDGGAGIDRLVADNLNGSTTSANIDIQSNGIVKNSSAFLVRYQAIEALEYYDSNASNRIGFINLNSSGTTQDIPEVTIKGNGGNDTFANTSANFPTIGYWPTSVPTGDIRLDGGPGSDTVLLNNMSDLGGSYVVNTDTITVSSSSNDSGTLTYLNCELVDFLSSPGNDTVILRSKLSTTALRFDTEAGTDSFLVGGGDINSNGFLLSNTTLVGGAGTDAIRFDDKLDAEGESETYTFGVFTLAKGSAGFNYSSFDTQVLDAADAANTIITPNIININAISGQISNTTINGAATLRDNFINIGNGNLVNLSGTLTLNTPGADVTINDQLETGNFDYTLTPTRVTRTQAAPGTGQITISYSSLAALVLNATLGTNKVLVDTTPAGRTTTINDTGGAFNSYRFGGGNVAANLLGPVTVNGPGGSSSGAVIDNSLDTTPSAQTLNGGVFTDGLSHTVNAVSSLAILNGGGGGTMDLNRVTIPTTADALASIVTVGAGNLDANVLAGVSVNNAASVTVDDRLDSGNDSYIIDATSSPDGGVTFRKSTPGAHSIGMGGFGAAILQANNGDNIIQVTQARNGVQIFGNGGNDTINVQDTAPFLALHTIEIDTGPETPMPVELFGDSVNVNSDVAGDGARVQLLNDDVIRRLTVNTNGTFIVPTGVTAQLGELIIPGGTIDLAGGALLSKPGGPSQATLKTLLTRGYNNGGWNGTNAAGSINSSLAASSPLSDGVGYGLGSQIAPTTIGSFNIGANDTLLRYTLDGDADLNTQVNLGDFNRLAANFGQSGKNWSDGDSNYDGTVNLADFNLLASQFGMALGPEVFGRLPIRDTINTDQLRELVDELT